jgi:hypothetical protein
VRVLKTFVLRLLIDSEAPHVLHGAVRAIADDEEYTFTDGQALLALLYEISLAALRTAGRSGPEEAMPGALGPHPEEGGEGGGEG